MHRLVILFIYFYELGQTFYIKIKLCYNKATCTTTTTTTTTNNNNNNNNNTVYAFLYHQRS